MQHSQKKKIVPASGLLEDRKDKDKNREPSGGYSNNPIKRWMVACTWKGSSKVGRCGQITQMGKSVGTKMFKAMLFVSEIN